MDIKEKQATWNQERPLFEADFIHSHLLPFFNFNENTGDYEIKSEFAEDEDRKVAFETLNTGWVMWLRAKRGAKAEIDPIFDIFHIGSNARNIRTLQVNIENSSRRSDCLYRIENIVTETLISDEPESYGEEYQESLLNWGESPDQYESRFKSIWDARQAEINELKAKLEAAQVPEGFVLVPKEFNEKLAEKMAAEMVNKPIPENDPVWIEIANKAYKDNLLMKKWEIIRNYKAMIEAAQGEGHE